MVVQRTPKAKISKWVSWNRARNQSFPKHQNTNLQRKVIVVVRTPILPLDDESDLSLGSSDRKSSSDSSDSSEENEVNHQNEDVDSHSDKGDIYSTPAKKFNDDNKLKQVDVSEIVFEQAEVEKDISFEVHHDIQDEGSRNPNDSMQVDKSDKPDMFDLRREDRSNTFLSPLGPMFKKQKDKFKTGTFASKFNYHPQESVDYMNNLQKSINNKNIQILTSGRMMTPRLENSMKKVREYMHDTQDSFVWISSGKKDLNAKRLDLNALDYSAAKNLEEVYNKKSIRGIQISDSDYIPSFEEEGKYPMSEDYYKDGMDTVNNTMYGDTSEIWEPNIPVLNIPKINELGNYNTHYERFYEEFYVIGVDSLSLDSVNQPKVVLRPSLLKNYPNREEHKERHDVIKDFCFPTGIGVEQIDLGSPDQEQKINEILFSRPVMVENCFLFTINANDYEKGIVYQDEYLNWLAVVTDEIMATDHNGTEMSLEDEDKLFITKKAYCIMFRGNHFLLQYQILSSLVKIIKHERTQKMNIDDVELFTDKKIYKEYEYLLADIHSMICLPTFTDKMKELLDTYTEIVPSSYSPHEILSIKSPCNLGMIQYLMPKNEHYLDIMWHGPFFFNKIDFSHFFYIFRAIMLEKSVVFISEDMNFLSSIINGYRILLKPFKWCHIFIAILPKLLIDYMCAPQPMLLGITKKLEFFEELDQDAWDDKIWVELDGQNQNPQVNIHDTQSVTECNLGGLEEELKNLWAKIAEVNDHDVRQSTYWISEKELEIWRDIAEAIETAIDRKILFWVRKFKKNCKTDDPEIDYIEWQNTVVEHADEVDKDFLREFVKTQMFAYYFDCL